MQLLGKLQVKIASLQTYTLLIHFILILACNNMLYPREDRRQKLLLFACRNCEHVEECVGGQVTSADISFI